MPHKKKSITQGGVVWYDFADPTETEVKAIGKEFGFHELDIEDCLTENQRPKIDEYDKYLFIVLHFPAYDSAKKRIFTAELNIFIGQNFIITLRDSRLSVVEKIWQECKDSPKARREKIGQGTGFLLYEIVSELFDACFPMVDKMHRQTRRIENEIFDPEKPRDLLRDIMLLKKNTITFRRILSSERAVVSAIEHKNKKFLPDDLDIYFDDIVDKTEKMWSSLESLKEVAETLQDANESLISHETGNTIRVLTVFSVILMPLTLITGIFGMNLNLPFEGSPLGFVFVAGIMLILSILMITFFRWKDLI